jgi:hypothetical protein
MKTVKTFGEFLIECDKSKKESTAKGPIKPKEPIEPKSKEEKAEPTPKKEAVELDDNFDEVLEKWEEDVKVKKTGEHAGKTVAELRKQMANLKGEKPFDREKYSELMFALRAKGGWKKGEGATKSKK